MGGGGGWGLYEWGSAAVWIYAQICLYCYFTFPLEDGYVYINNNTKPRRYVDGRKNNVNNSIKGQGH